MMRERIDLLEAEAEAYLLGTKPSISMETYGLLVATSQAISLKRIADALEKIEKHLEPAVIEGATPLLQPNLGDWINGKTDDPPEFMKP